MNDNREKLHQKLEQELNAHTFQNTEAVIKRTHPKTWSERVSRWLNKDIEVSLLPVSATVCGALLLVTLPFVSINDSADQKGELVNLKGSIYWSEMIEERLGDK
ncbi:hypothetical protein [Alkalihalobacterium elongatum]|uniref:hypothetical protein n=1 Tax=Alkalihalobacterium elongatum TaxID=2675466 RepID=UPI001C2014A8|nr:hypothetical protein [Alkalihalobacterium elongatum]